MESEPQPSIVDNKPIKKRWLNSTILGVGVASFFSDVGHEMATTALPALLATIGGASATLGIIEGLADGLSSFAKLFSGLYSDRLEKRKPLAVVGYFVTASGMASFGLATQLWHVLLGRVLGWIGRGARTPVRNVLLTEATTAETYGKAFGLERAMDSAGAVVGPLLATLLVAQIGLRETFFLTLIPGLLAACCIWFLVKEKPHQAQPHTRLLSGLSLLPHQYKKFLLGVGIAGIGDFSNTLLILWATQSWLPIYGTLKATSMAMGFYVLFNIIYSLTCYLSGSFADRYPKHLVLAFGYAVAVIPAIALIIPGGSILKFAVVFIFSGFYMGIWETVESTSAASLLPKELRGVGFGALATVNGIGDLISSIAVGVLWAATPLLAMGFVIVTSLIGAGIIASSKRY